MENAIFLLSVVIAVLAGISFFLLASVRRWRTLAVLSSSLLVAMSTGALTNWVLWLQLIQN
ncbi:hypothetical protein [uncultured Ferrimonas sp.]|uniref:hypothetical protein n=1 Tax=uncultured Ferrimonas sp. TaxID=432640 RepID=UPI002605BA40|nr:hypothetical protein [uncultured Ferrimonas sp.]